MVFCRREEENEMHLSINNVAVENVPSFVYTLTWNNDCSVEIKNRIQKATGVYSDLKVIWNVTKRKFSYWMHVSFQYYCMRQIHGR